MSHNNSSTKLVRARDWEPFMNMTRREQDVFLAELWFRDNADEPFDPGADDLPEYWEIVENFGPTLVEITDYIGDGPDAEEATWTVEAGPNSPSYRLVA